MIPSILLLLLHTDSRPIAWCVIGLCAGLYLFFNGFRLLARRRLILDTPVSKIRSAAMGMVELSGLAVGPYTVTAPITGRSCYYYRTVVWEWKRQGRSRQWVKVAGECVHVPFFLDDDTGKVMVDPRGAELDLHRDFQQEFCDSLFTAKEEVPPSVRTLLLRHGISTSNKIKVEEFCIKPKNALFLLGTLGENLDLELKPQPIYDDEHNTLTLEDALWFNPMRATMGNPVLSFASGDGSQHFAALEEPADTMSFQRTVSPEPHVINLSPDIGPTKASDMSQQQKIAAALMKAGISNPAAWAAAGVSESSSSSTPVFVSDRSATSPANSFDPHPGVILMKGKNNPTFLISWRSQHEIARSLGWKCALMIWGGPALALLCLYGLLTLTRLI